MATGWGAYFASYVKKKEEAPKAESGADDPSIVPTKPMSVVSRSNTAAKKLYSSPAVPTTTVPPTRSNSNAARVANMFGYAAAAKAKMDLEAAYEVKEEPKIVEEVKSLSSLKNLATQLQSLEEATHPVEAQKPVVPEVKEKAKVTERVKSPSGLSGLAAQLESLDEVEDLWESQKPNPPMTKTKDVSIAPAVLSFLKKSEPAQDTMQTRMPAKSVPAPQERRRVPRKGKSSISDLDALMGMLEMDLSMNTDTPSSRQASTQERGLSTVTTSMVAQGADTVSPATSSQPWIPNSYADEPAFFASPIEAPIRAPSFGSSPIKAPLPALTEASIEEIPIMLQTNLPPDPAETPRYFALSSSPISEPEDEEEKYNGPSILEYQRMSEQIRQQQEQMEMERRRMLEEEERFEREEKKLAEEDEMMRQFVEEVEREEKRIREDDERQAREQREREQDEESDYGDDSDSDRRDSFDRLEQVQERAGYQSPEVRIYEEEIEAERLRYTEKEDEARLEVQRLEDERLTKQQRQAEREQAELEKEARLEEERIKEERMAWRRRREEKERERERREEEEARLEAKRLEEERIIQEEEERFEAERLEQERVAFEMRRAEEERQERLRIEEEYRQEARRMEKRRIAERARLEEEREREEQLRFEEEEKEREQLRLQEEAKWEAEQMQAEQDRLDEQRRIDEERAEQQRYEEEQARLEAERIRQEQVRMAEQRRMKQERHAQLEAEEESDDDPMDKEAQMRKAEEKIRAAFAGLAQERGQGGPALAAPIAPKANLGLDVTRAEKGISRNNTIGMRPQPPPKSPGVMRLNTVAGRPGGLPSGPRGGGLPSGPRAGLPAGPRPRRI